jgi:hypothetical protein
VFNDLNIQLNKNYIEKLVDNKSPNVNQIYQEIFESNNYEEKLSSLFGDKQPYLAQVVWLKCLDELVDCVDLSIKSLTGSTLYIKDDQSDAVSSQKTQFDHFKTLLHESYTLLKTILCLKNPDQTKDAFEKNKISPCTHQLISRLNEGFDNFDNLYSGKNFSLSKIMNPSPNFNVAEQIIGNVTAYVGLRRINAIETGDDLFTTIHQNELSTLSTLNKIILGKNEIKLNPYATLFMNLIKNEGGTRYFSKPDLRNMEIKGKKIILNYTVALNNHSSTIRFACDKDGSHAEMTIDFFGSNNGRDRWEVIKSEIEKDFSSSIKTIVQNNQGVSATLAIPKVDLTESGLRKYFRAFEVYVLISNGWHR